MELVIVIDVPNAREGWSWARALCHGALSRAILPASMCLLVYNRALDARRKLPWLAARLRSHWRPR